eukprot:SAG22_NODE_6811_length_808_cov_1.475317_1_plen_38_part_10
MSDKEMTMVIASSWVQDKIVSSRNLGGSGSAKELRGCS